MVNIDCVASVTRVTQKFSHTELTSALLPPSCCARIVDIHYWPALGTLNVEEAQATFETANFGIKGGSYLGGTNALDLGPGPLYKPP